MKLYRSIPIKLSEFKVNEAPNKIQVLRAGTFYQDGVEIKVTAADLASMVKNFKENARGIDLMLDYSHESEKEAAAWFKDVFLSEDGNELWAEVEWTVDGKESVEKKKYRYISADFNFAYKDNETLKNYGPTLFGAGLTNRPLVKKMNPTIELSEYKLSTGEEKMTPEEKKKMEGLEQECADLKKKLAEMEKAPAKKLDENSSEKEKELAEREAKIKLAEDKIKEDAKLAEKKTAFDKLLSDGKVVEAQRDAYMKDNFTEFVAKGGQVNLDEKGNGGNGNEDKEFANSKTPAQDKLISLAEKKVKEDKNLSLREAQRQVLAENPELNKAYKKETESE